MKTASGLSTGFVTDYARHSPEDKSVANNLREGPIQPGGYLVLGSFEDILQSAVGTDQSPPQTQKDALEHAKRLQICIAATHGPSQHLIGARRSFDISRNGEAGHLQAQSIYTEQLTSKRKRREVRQWVQERLQPRYDSENQDRDSEQRV
ncbi:hypothetical protein [Gilvimarinus algae]|uniref:Uncharacterized protein n=1 Tax=Gilvimarinus algae TaxID=3058037 RepID=A0ABT8TC99_9GAMM|nr:hypothetical protein [Gilvimarinus sp. SDUM040014]MDO3380758.1 hypothetical protein [Gilvimarinus sp. SDUM040014]